MTDETPSSPEPVKLPWHATFVAGWPLILIVLGGALGGLCGGAAFAASMSIIKKKGPSFLSYMLSGLIGGAAVLLWLAVIIVLALIFPDLFAE